MVRFYRFVNSIIIFANVCTYLFVPKVRNSAARGMIGRIAEGVSIEPERSHGWQPRSSKSLLVHNIAINKSLLYFSLENSEFSFLE